MRFANSGGVSTWVAGMAAVALLCGCPKRKTGADGGSEAGAVAEADAAATAEPGAANSNLVARFGDETKIADEAAGLTAGVLARLAPPNGQVVATLTKGTNVTKVAEHEGFVLVVFTNPKNANEQLMGWVPGATVGVASTGGVGTGAGTGGGTGHGKKGDGGAADGGAADGGAAVAAADAGAAAAAGGARPDAGGVGGAGATGCAAGQISLIGGVCAKKCNTNADCQAGRQACAPGLVSAPNNFQKVCLPP
jgi:hypothetical protein